MKVPILALIISAPLWPAALTLGGVPGLDAGQFRITTFASGLSLPYGMAADNAGGVLVGTLAPGANFGTGWQVLRLHDSNHDGVADGPGMPVMSGDAGLVTAVTNVGPFVAVGLAGRPASVQLYAPSANPDAPYTLLGSLNIGFTQGWSHNTPGLAARPTPGQPSSYDLFFNVGSLDNQNNSPAVSLSGLVSSTIAADSIYRVTLSLSANSVQATGLTQVASGIRNAVGMGFHPGTGDFYFVDNGIDGLIDGNEPLSADELNRIGQAALNDPAPDFGFASSYTTYRTGTVVGGGTPPFVAFQPLGNPFMGSESEGPAGLAFSPNGFPGAVANGVFVGFHGKYNLTGIANEENPLVYVDLATGQYYHFISNDDPNVGHLDSLLSTADSLFLADFSSTSGDGVIYQITAVPEARTWMYCAVGLVVCLLCRRLWIRLPCPTSVKL